MREAESGQSSGVVVLEKRVLLDFLGKEVREGDPSEMKRGKRKKRKKVSPPGKKEKKGK